ncbi:diaminopimelate epimerase [Corynebacterium bovis]|uniref:diaminopimelate epimerase n=1 Tax=Corynebacterium bovis TaxID=36808 RepID=UPI003138C084
MTDAHTFTAPTPDPRRGSPAGSADRTDTALTVVKAHGTGNDFVVVPDPDALVDVTPELVRGLCDRHRGVGGDGLIRVATCGALVRAGVLDAVPDGLDDDSWFMDYRNADGSTAEMCGNGVRVFGHVLHARGLLGDAGPGGTEVTVGTRAGARTLRVHSADDVSADVSVDMGVPAVTGVSTCTVGDRDIAGLAVDMGNPHLAAVVPGLTAGDLADLPLDRGVTHDEAFFPDGVNVEVVTALADGVVRMRVHERGVGETLSCGTGTVAAAVAALADAGEGTGTVDVHVPGGVVSVTVEGDDEGITGSTLRGPSRIVFATTVDPAVLAG